MSHGRGGRAHNGGSEERGPASQGAERNGTMIDQVAIIGDGQMATVCALLLAEKGVRVRMWSALCDNIEAMKATRENRRFLPGYCLPPEITLTTDPRVVFDHAEIVISALPTQFVRPVWRQLKGATPIGVPVCSVTKGIENDTLMRPTQILTDVLGPAPVAALSGPSIAVEVAQRLPATVVAASEDLALATAVQQLFAAQWFRVYTNTDLLGVELAGATKNVIALAAGIIDGLGAGDNAKAALLARGLAEITRLGVALGARPETFFGLAGVGDLVTTCISPSGRNRSAGEAIGRGRTMQEAMAATTSVIEGIPTTRSVRELARRLDVPMPLTEAVHAVLFEGKDVLKALTDLMSRELRDEG